MPEKHFKINMFCMTVKENKQKKSRKKNCKLKHFKVKSKVFSTSCLFVFIFDSFVYSFCAI